MASSKDKLANKKATKPVEKAKDVKAVDKKATKPVEKAKAKPVEKAKDVKAVDKKATKPVEKAKAKDVKVNPLQVKFETALTAVKVTADKIKISENEVTIQTADRLSAKQIGKLKTVAGKKMTLSTRGESWIMTYA